MKKNINDNELFERNNEGIESIEPSDEELNAIVEPNVLIKEDIQELGDSVRIYLNEIDDIPILSLNEEIELSQRVKLGDIEAKDIFIKSNLKLVVSVAFTFNKYTKYLPDLIQEGNIGLMKAVEKFDCTRGYKFSTYATWWIRHFISRYIENQSRTVRLPIYLFQDLNKYYRIQNNLLQQLHREPNIHEIAKAMNVSVKHVKKIEMIAQDIISLDLPVGDDQNIFLYELLTDNPNENEVVYYSLLKEELEKVLLSLKPIEAQVLKLRYGLVDDKFRTLEEIAKSFCLTKERIRQIEAKALRKIRNPIRSRKLVDFFIS